MTPKILFAGVLAMGMAVDSCSTEATQTAVADTATAQAQEAPAAEDPQDLPGTGTATEPGDTIAHALTSSSDKPLFESPNYKTGGKIKPGRYACQEMGMQLKSLSEMGTFKRSTTRWTSQFEMTDTGKYTYLGSTPQPGNFRYNQASGTITWASGPYSSEPGEEDTITGIYTTRLSDNNPVILLVFRSPAYGESCEYCALVPAE